MGNMCDSFIIYEDNQNEFKVWQGLIGAHYTPHVDSLGNLSWTNNGDLPNPPTVNIAGKGLNIVGIVDADTDLPETANNFDVYLVGTEDPYSAYIYDDGTWYNLGIVGQGEKGDKGDPGVGVPTGGTTGQVLKKASNTNYDTEWADESGAVLSVDGKTGNVTVLPTGGTSGQVLSKASGTDYDVEWADASGGDVQTVNNVQPDANGNVQIAASNIGTNSNGITVQNAIDDAVHVGTSAPTDPTTKIWLDTDEPGMSVVSSVNGKTGTVVLDLDDIGFMTLLWTNASPTSNFAAQTVSLDLSGYDAVFVISNLMTTGENNTGVFVRKGLATETNIVMYGAIVAASAMTVQRRGVTATDTGVVFSDAKLKAATSTSAGSKENSRCIPLYIYGIKGVTA